ncbi:Gfo/Idh/MocA family protein [Roseovarius sp. C7]|uniref:Gfo/Idh/MocA family protein n=1 Tax=Roseovarius sp. C7 TaxID=3398643 RepID=UPI0039F73C54
MTKPLKIAFAGTGSIGQRHLRNLISQAPDTQVLFLRAGSRKDALSEEVDAKVVPSIEAVISENPDGLVISTPSAFHGETLLKSVSANIPVYIEKPVVTSREELASLDALLLSRPTLPSLIGCNLRFVPSLQSMHSLAQREIGNLVRASFEAGQWLPDWRPSQNHRHSYSAKTEAGGGVILDLLHEIDAASWICGDMEILAAT